MTVNYQNKVKTKKLLPFRALVEALRQAVLDYQEGLIVSPNRLVTPMAGGVMLTMPASAPDVAMTKLINIVPDNPQRGLETINGQVTMWDVNTGLNLCILDGPTVTARRTAAISMLAIELLATRANKIVLFGCGHQAANHLEALSELFPNCTVYVLGSMLAKAKAFCAAHAVLNLTLEAVSEVPDDVDVVITTTTSEMPVYTERARKDRLIIAVGVFQPDHAEIVAETVLASQLFIDDLPSAEHEAGDFLLAGVDLKTVHSLYRLVSGSVERTDQPALFKSVGCAAWDLAACRVVLANLNQNRVLGG